MKGTIADRQAQPDPETDIAAKALQAVKESLARHPGSAPIRVRVQEEAVAELVLPREAVELLAKVLAHMAAGRAVSVVPAHAELTTQQAADLLNVSRPFLIGLLKAGEIDYRLVGSHRRIRADSLLDYRRRDDQSRREAADELTSLNQEMGLV
ncbi:helix-turn-helix domain-containing protein [Kitasatospora mediocidica]|uniref:helix-turn-helix domain-containing protein n=1 Tax=Kitasatospora mediocidica TaxID=58352 RepID=UPI000691C0F9|nr:helix-turn-helix domain-containing protein [Kitasatospora mediocidica]